jgi:hypothetical protein
MPGTAKTATRDMTWEQMDRIIDQQVKRDSKLLKVLSKL